MPRRVHAVLEAQRRGARRSAIEGGPAGTIDRDRGDPCGHAHSLPRSLSKAATVVGVDEKGGFLSLTYNV